MKIEITKVVVTKHPFGMDTVHLYTKHIDPCDKDVLLTVNFKTPRGTAAECCKLIFGGDVEIEHHNFSA